MPPSRPELMPSSSSVSYKLLSLVKATQNDSLCFVWALRVCFLVVFFGFTANKIMTYERCSHLLTKCDLCSLTVCSHKLQDDEQWGVCCNISCVKAKVSHHTKCLAAHRGQMWPFLNKATWFLDLSEKWWLKCVFSFFFLFVCSSEWPGLLLSPMLFQNNEHFVLLFEMLSFVRCYLYNFVRGTSPASSVHCRVALWPSPAA